MEHEFRHSLSAAKFFRSIGLVPLPSRMDGKRPALMEYRKYQADKPPDCLYAVEQWRTTNLQLMTGALTSGATKVIVVDLDGTHAVAAWKRMCAKHGYTIQGIWISRTGSGGIHLYYRLPMGTHACKTRFLWGLYDPQGGPAGNGGWLAHHEVRLLGDGALAVAPPSRHVQTGREYQWVGKWSPAVFALPAEAPQWLLDAPEVDITPVTQVHTKMQPTPRQGPSRDSGRDEALRRLSASDKLNLAASWGLRLAAGSHARQTWACCHAIDREDATPSAGFCPATGVYHDFGGSLRKLSLFDLAVALGAHRTWLEALKEVELRVAC